MSTTTGIDWNQILFHYTPVKIVPDVFLTLFTVAAIAFTIRIYLSKAGKWLYILPATALAEAIGYALRTACTFDTTLNMYIVMSLFLLLPPNALALINYKALAKVIELKGEIHGLANDPFWMRPRFVSTFFFASDMLAFFLQGAGGGLQSVTSLADIGRYMTLVGLAVQLVFFSCFTYIAVLVARRPEYKFNVVKMPTGQPVPHAKHLTMKCLFVTITLLYIRSIYRLVEYAEGNAGAVTSQEWVFYVFDSDMIFGCFICYFILFLGDYLPNGVSVLQAKEEQEVALRSLLK